MQPIGIFGGTFDPIHFGHLRTAQEIMRTLVLEEVRFVPAAFPPHRRTPVANAEERLRMVDLAVSEFPGFRADDRELRRAGPSYTVPTLESFRAELGQRPICLIVGVDAFHGIESWHRASDLPQLAHLVVVRRPGWDFAPDEKALPQWLRGRRCTDPIQLAGVPSGKLVFQSVSPHDISGSRIRAMLACGESVHGMVPAVVEAFIASRGLYRNPTQRM
ncbi:MAG: nicotinate-nucleotide adenylyltransferase [Gammaproteobacteria bacterium]|nr:nicotinate-nucleotide adenylyltransferase [Gammaproteobacteria bacterium]